MMHHIPFIFEDIFDESEHGPAGRAGRGRCGGPRHHQGPHHGPARHGHGPPRCGGFGMGPFPFGQFMHGPQRHGGPKFGPGAWHHHFGPGPRHGPGHHHGGPGGHHHHPHGHHGTRRAPETGLHLLKQHNGEGSVHVEVTDAEEAYFIFVEVPGVPRSNITTQLDSGSGLLIIAGSPPASADPPSSSILLEERERGGFRREFKLPEDVAVDSISAKLSNGELTVTLLKIPKPELISIPIVAEDEPTRRTVDTPTKPSAEAPTKPDAAAPMEEDQDGAWVDLSEEQTDKGKSAMDYATAKAIALSLQELDEEGHVSDAE